MMPKSSTEDGPTLEWVRSSHSTPDGPDCVEVATAPDTVRVRVRDSKHIHGPRLTLTLTLTLTPKAWAEFPAHTTGH